LSPFVTLLRIILSIFCGGLIGLEREDKRRPAGFRTHVLVCLGSSIIMILSEHVFRSYNHEFGTSSDPLRLGAQVISGIGFLGAGTIMRYGTNIKGLTTAASLWTVAAIGLSLGSGYYFLGISSSITVYIILVVFNKVEKKWRMKKHSFNTYEINIKMKNNAETLGKVNLIFHKYKAKILEMKFESEELEQLNDDDDIPITLFVIFRTLSGLDLSDLTQDINHLDGIISVERF